MIKAASLKSLQAGAARMNAASLTLLQQRDAMKSRTSATIIVCYNLYEEFLAVIDRLSASLKLIARAHDTDMQLWLTKAADDHEAMATLTEAAVAMSEDLRTSVFLVLASLASFDTLLQSMNGIVAHLCVPISTLAISALSRLSTVWCELPDAATSVVSGSGTKHFMKGAAGATRNVVLVYPRVVSGALAEYVKPDDVCSMLRDDAGSLIDVQVTTECVADGGTQLAYSVAVDCVCKISMSVSVCGVPLASVTILSGYDAINGATHVASYSVNANHKDGMAVNAAGSWLALSNHGGHQVHVFRLTPSFERVNVIGRYGREPAELNYPARLCFADDDTILVCDSSNNRVQQLTVAGAYLSSFHIQRPFSIAVHGDVVAVGTSDGSIEIHLLSTGELVRRFGSVGYRPGQISGLATGIRFTSDGARLIVVERNTMRLSLFSVNGVFMKNIGSSMIATGFRNDVSFGAGGEMIVTDQDKHRIRVFSAKGDTLIKTWGSERTSAGQFQAPTALAVAGPYLYVLSFSRLHIFE